MTRRYIVDHAKAKTVEDLVSKAASEAAKPLPASPTDVSLDKLMQDGLTALAAIMRSIKSESGVPTRETVQNLKDVMAIIKDLKKEEREFLEGLSDKELENLNASVK